MSGIIDPDFLLFLFSIYSTFFTSFYLDLVLAQLVFVPAASFVHMSGTYLSSLSHMSLLPHFLLFSPSLSHHMLDLLMNLVVYGLHVYKTAICVSMNPSCFLSSKMSASLKLKSSYFPVFATIHCLRPLSLQLPTTFTIHHP